MTTGHFNLKFSNPVQSQSTNEIIENILKRAAIELGIKNEDSNENNLAMARSGSTIQNVVISNTSGITANILFQPGEILKSTILIYHPKRFERIIVFTKYKKDLFEMIYKKDVFALFRIGIDSKSNRPNSSNVHGIGSTNDRQGFLERDKFAFPATKDLRKDYFILLKD